MVHESHNCTHDDLIVVSSPHAGEVGYQWRSQAQRTKAADLATTTVTKGHMSAFPAPLILPGDDLAIDPKYPPQSVRSWSQEKDRNKVTAARQTIYVVAAPMVPEDISIITGWTIPVGRKASDHQFDPPDVQDIADYVSTFFHGLPVKVLPSNTLSFSAWSDEPGYLRQIKSTRTRKAMTLGLDTTNERIGIRTRMAPDKAFVRQLNLNDLIDVGMSILPDDAYAMVMLVNHDLYEDDDDDFACGRAYGASRVAVVSSARYHPSLDESVGLDALHEWPNAHCVRFVDRLLAQEYENLTCEGAETETVITSGSDVTPAQSPLIAASQAARAFQASGLRSQSPTGLWLGRVCRTVSHELGHCFGIDHCVYHACCMQGTASVSEDVRQPPYLCPVDLEKVTRSTGKKKEQHYISMHEFCKKHSDVELFVAYEAWIRTVTQQTEHRDR